VESEAEDSLTLGELTKRAAEVIAKYGFEHRIDIYRTVEIADPWILESLGRKHRIKVRVKITAASLLFDGSNENG
jgi:hypothetical protein